jgi:prophage regulatory protein
MPVKMLRAEDVMHARGCSRSKLYEDIREGRFPKPVKLGPRMSRWPESDLEAEQQALIEARNKAAQPAAKQGAA